MASVYRVRRATLRDLDVLVEQRRKMWGAISDHTEEELDKADPVYRRWARQRMRSGRLVGWLVEDAERNVVAGGCVWVRENQPRPGWDDLRIPYLLSMWTEPGHRGHGLASRIVREALAWAKRAGYQRMTLHASDEGRAVYESIGFRRTWEMRYRLRPANRRSRTRRRKRLSRPRGSARP